ncbi:MULTISPECIES: hypothetical protein [unclassified Corynebacterium]|nr:MULTISPECIES: hypothetical protein [unclassified Corynebacterium]MCQ4609982.1 hypothetical protein [Corynebacterium sp. CCUG 61414]MDK8364616.1 hypothetical protein [Corynebacterium sp. UMB10119B]
MSTIAVLAFFLAYIVAPSSPIVWILLAVAVVALTWDTVALVRKDASR